MKNERQLLTVEDGPLMQGRESVRYLILHCSATRCDKDYTAEQLLRDHKTRGFRTVGYHFYIRRDGTITQHRKLLEVGAHCRPWNRGSLTRSRIAAGTISTAGTSATSATITTSHATAGYIPAGRSPWRGRTASVTTATASASATRAVWMRTDIRQTPGPQSRQNSLPCC